MIRLPGKHDEDPIAFLVRRKFSDRLAVRKALGTLEDTFIGEYPRPEINETTAQQASAYIAELSEMDPDARTNLYEAEQVKAAEEGKRREEEEERKLFFHQPEADANYSHWCRASCWTLDEATALSFGKDPSQVSWKRIEPYLKPRSVSVSDLPFGAFQPPSPFAQSYERLRDLATRAKATGQLYDPVLPGFYLGWAIRTQVEVPAKLIEGVRAFGNQIADWKALYDELRAKHDQKNEELEVAIGELSRLRATVASTPAEAEAKALKTRERETVLKLIIGMAVEQYSYDPFAGRNSAIANIAADLEQVGVALDPDTIRKWLSEARELLPRDEAAKDAL